MVTKGRRTTILSVLLPLLAFTGCAKGQSDDEAALAAAREAAVRAEAELKAIKELNAKAQATPATPAPPETAARAPEAPAAPVAAAEVQKPAPANPLPDAGRIKGDLIGRTISGGLLKKYQFQSLGEFLSFAIINRNESGNVAEFTVDTVLRKEPGSSKRCFSNLLVTYQRTTATEAWALKQAKANTLTCE